MTRKTKTPAGSAKPKITPKTAKRIVVTGDLLRPSAGGMQPTQHENISWIYQLLKTPLNMATGLPVEILHWDGNWINQSRLDSGTIEAIYRMMGMKPGVRTWARLFSTDAFPAPVEDMFLRMFKDSFVVGFELPPYLVAFFARHDIGFVDCSLSTVRFMDDMLFAMSSNSEAITQALGRYAVSDDFIRLQAGMVSSNVAKANPKPPRPNSLLVILQTCFDKVVIDQGRFVTVLEYFDTLKSIAKGYDHLLIKEHPFEPQPETVEYLTKMMPRVRVTEDNFYRLVSHDNVTGVMALSSSCVHEASYFGKAGHYLLPGYDLSRHVAGIQSFNIDDVLISPDFWRDVLAESQCAVTALDGLRLPSKPNRFRQQLRSAWSYNQIDTDIAVQWAPKPD